MATKKLARHRVQTLLAALQKMDGEPEAIKNRDGQVIAIKTIPYVFAKPYVKQAVAATAAGLDAAVDAIAKGEAGLIKKYQERWAKEHADDKVPALEVSELNEAVTAYRQMRVDVPVRKIKYADLDVDTNKIPASVVVGLLPILIDFPTETQEAGTGAEWEEPEWSDPESAEPANAEPSVNGKTHEPEAVGA